MPVGVKEERVCCVFKGSNFKVVCGKGLVFSPSTT